MRDKLCTSRFVRSVPACYKILVRDACVFDLNFVNYIDM